MKPAVFSESSVVRYRVHHSCMNVVMPDNAAQAITTTNWCHLVKGRKPNMLAAAVELAVGEVRGANT